ncbi:MAG: hypothetical protein IKD15_02010 [Clostridia bacterium]|nr:hypothetical protein [Clostridia bacterium]
MPIGKNAIKRVENNGYSNVKTSAPDMENSNVIANPDTQVVEKLIKPVESAAAKKAPAKKPAASTSAAKKAPAKKPAVKAAPKAAPKAPAKDGFVRVSFGEEMPFYLL